MAAHTILSINAAATAAAVHHQTLFSPLSFNSSSISLPLHSSFHGASVKYTTQFQTLSAALAASAPKPLTVVSATKKAVAVLKGTSSVEGVVTLTQNDEDLLQATVDGGGGGSKLLSGKERRELKKERRTGYDWKQEVEERLIKKPKKRYSSWTEELNLDNLSLSGPQWWILRVSKLSANYTAELMARSLARYFPSMDFKVYIPSVQIKKILKSGTISVKPRPLFPGCVFLRCILNKQVHDFILEECIGVRGFVGVTVGNTKRQINKPRPVDDEDMEVIFRKVKEEQEIAEQAFLEQNNKDGSSHPEPSSGFPDSQANSVGGGEHGSLLLPNGRARKAKASSASKNIKAVLRPGSPVRIVLGAFAGFSGVLKKASLKKKTVTVGFTLFGKETIADLDIGEVVADTS